MFTFTGRNTIKSFQSVSIPLLFTSRLSNTLSFTHLSHNPYHQQHQEVPLLHCSSIIISKMSASTNNDSNLPAKPYAYYSSSSIHSLDLTELDATISIAEVERQEAYDTSSKIKVLIIKTKRSLEQQQQQQQEEQDGNGMSSSDNDNGASNEAELEALITNALPSEKQSIRVANLSFQFQDYARLKSYQYFLSHGKLLPPSNLPATISDEEYLAGAVIGFTQDLARYVIGRATARDLKSVMMARDVTGQCLSYLMQYDFRNGMLRRKYDGVKYALKTCETVLYELSVTGMHVNDQPNHDDGIQNEPLSKRLKSNETTTETSNNDHLDTAIAIIPKDELEEVRSRIEGRDELREKLIKRCRDAQKAAKQAIYALHRSDSKGAAALLHECEQIVLKDLNPMVEEDPSLHYGSYANVLEEYAEAKLFFVWLMGEGDATTPCGLLLTPNDFTTIALEPAEYLGGLCDLTGEVGRYAVQRGTKRDSKGVQFCLDTNLSILFSLETLQRFPSGSHIHKKMDQLRRTVEKLERMLYELSLVEATGRQIVVDSVKMVEEDK